MKILSTLDKIRILKTIECSADWHWRRSRTEPTVRAQATIENDIAFSCVLSAANAGGWIDLFDYRTITLTFSLDEMVSSANLCWRIPTPREDMGDE